MGPEDIEGEAELKFEAAVIELENVIVDTAKYEARAWEKVAIEHGIFNEDWEEELKQRGEGSIATKISDQSYLNAHEKQDLIDRKEDYYRQEAEELSARDILPGIEPLLKNLKKNGVRIAAASHRKQADDTIETLGLGDFFDEIIDEADISNDKPLSDKFFAAADDLEALYKKCIAIVSVELKLFRQGKKPSLFIVGVGSRKPVEGTDWVVESTGELTYKELKERFLKNH